MSDKIYLKEITLPIVETGENETYSFVQTDDGLDTPGDAADSKETGDRLNSLKQDLEGLDVYTLGLYPQMSVADTAVASFTDGADNIPVKSLTVDITPVQSGSGDPSPSNVRPISGWTGANVSVFDVNVWDEEWELGGINASTGANEADSTKIRSKNFGCISPSTSYYLKSAVDFTVIMFYDASKNYITYSASYVNQAFTTPANACYFKLRIGSAGAPTRTYNHDISINYPATDHDYHAYKGNVYPITFPTSAGTVYGGTLDVTSGVLSVTKRRVNLGALTWTYDSQYGYFYSSNIGSDILVPESNNDIGEILSSQYKTRSYNVAAYSDQVSLGIGLGYTSLIAIKDPNYTDATTFTTAMASVDCICALKVPQTYQLDPTEVDTLLGQNNIFCDTGDIAELTYRADLKAYIDSHVGS